MPPVPNRVPSVSQLLARWPSFLLGAGSALLTAIPARAAETVDFSFWLLEWSVSVDSLQAFAEDGRVESDLGFFLGFTNEQQEAELRNALNVTNSFDQVAIAQIFYDPMGEQALEFIGNLIQTESRQNGLYAIRAALIQAGGEPAGFTVLDILQNFPSNAVQIDLEVALRGIRRADAFFRQTDRVIAGIEALARAKAATEPPLNLDALPDLTQPGPYAVTPQTLVLQNNARIGATAAMVPRQFPVDLYLPVVDNAAPGSIPVVIISHGLGSQRSDFVDVATHLASYGFLVALPEHVDSNKALQDAVLAGRAPEFFRASEFLNRPLDISHLLDELEQRNATEFGDRLQLDQVAVIGHSFGGYAVLALAGATVDFQHLHQSCDQDSFLDFLNPALLLQCRALELEDVDQVAQQLASGVQDPRVGFAIAINPVNRIVFGPDGLRKIEVPVVMMGGGYDVATPLLPEQVYAFTQISSPEKYLVMVEGQAHAPAISELVNRILSPSLDAEQLQEELQLMRSKGIAILLAFLQVYLGDRPEYRPLLQASYMAQLTDPPFEFNLIRSLSETQLEQMIRGESTID
jgi:predicted dienelactone hydrolase